MTNFGDNNISGYTIDSATGALTTIAGSPFASGGAGPQSAALDPSGKFLYVVNGSLENFSGDNVSGYTINPTTGALTPITGSPFPAGSGPEYVAVDPSGKFVYVTNSISDTLSGYAINPATGALTAIAGSPFAAGSAPAVVAVDPSGKFVYVPNNFSNDVSGYTIDPGTRALTAIAGSPFATGIAPFHEMAVRRVEYIKVNNSVRHLRWGEEIKGRVLTLDILT